MHGYWGRISNALTPDFCQPENPSLTKLVNLAPKLFDGCMPMVSSWFLMLFAIIVPLM
ncbi:MAG: hypothetical protein CM15mP39_01720 [Synechococcus sp.]|nr:MAG: hypothetical protein CM15mP39_01720 [Synechococcus sp.]